MIAPHAIDQVKEAARIEEVVGEFVALKRKGPRYLGLCPFHNEKTPSFNVSPHLGIFKCFGCGESGDAIAFLRKHEHLGYLEAIRWLAKRYGIELPEEAATPEQELERNERENIAVIQAFAATWSQHQLWETDEGRRIGLAYLRERGFRDDTIRAFGLGYVPERGDAFAKAAQEQGFAPELLEQAGWIKRREDGTAWDFFAGRVTFPVHGLGGQVIAFGARTLKSDKKLPKYFNSPESALYVKSRSLYGIAMAKRSMAESGVCHLVEGYTDVISLNQAGIHNVVASSGTSLTEDQVRLIKRYASQVVILYDGDPAGMKASLRGIDLILAEGLAVKVVVFPEGEDPDSFAKARPSSEVSTFLADTAKDFLEFKTALLAEGTERDPVARAAAINDIVASIAQVPDPVLRALYTQRCARLLDVHEQALIGALNKVLRQRFKRRHDGEEPPPEATADLAPRQPEAPTQDPGTTPQERDLLRMLLNYGHERVMAPYKREDGSQYEEETSVAELLFELLALDNIQFDDTVFQEIYLDYRHGHNLGRTVQGRDYTGHDREEWRALSIDLLTERHELSPNWKTRHRIHVVHERDRLMDALIEGIDILRERRVDRMLRQKQELLKEERDPLRVRAILTEISSLNDAKRGLAKRTGRVVVG